MAHGLVRMPSSITDNRLSLFMVVVQTATITFAESSLVNVAQLSNGTSCDVFLPPDQQTSPSCTLVIDEDQGVNQNRVWGVQGNSAGVKFTITLPEVYTIEQIWLQQGFYTKDKNIKTIDITAQNGTFNKRVELVLRSNIVEHEVVNLSPPVETNIVHILIVDVYSAESTIWTIISDIQLLTEIVDEQSSTLQSTTENELSYTTTALNAATTVMDDEGRGSLGTPAIAGIAIGILLALLISVGFLVYGCRRKRSQQTPTQSTALPSSKDVNGAYYNRAVESELGAQSKVPPVPTPTRPIPATPPSPPARRPSGYPHQTGESAVNSHHDSGNEPPSSGDGVYYNTNDRESQQDHSYKKADGTGGDMYENIAINSEEDMYQNSSGVSAKTESLYYDDTAGLRPRDSDEYLVVR